MEHLHRSELDTLTDLYVEPKSVSSAFARYNAQQLASLSSKGWITTQLPNTTGGSQRYGRMWRITALGAQELNSREIIA